jgi:hypothetical protein
MSFRPGDGGKGSGRRPGTGFGEGHDRIFGAKSVVPPALPKTTSLNVRHDLDQTLVAAQVEAKIAEHNRNREHSRECAKKTVEAYELARTEGTAHHWPRPPTGPQYVDPLYDEWIEAERNYFARVRVIELPLPGKRFILVYGDQNDATVRSGTGPFESLEKAAAWFYAGGR